MVLIGQLMKCVSWNLDFRLDVEKVKEALKFSGGGGSGYRIFMAKFCCFNSAYSQVRKYHTLLLCLIHLSFFFFFCRDLIFWGCANFP